MSGFTTTTGRVPCTGCAEGRAGGGGAIDLVQYLKDIGFREAVRELGGLAGSRGASGLGYRQGCSPP